MDNNLYKRFHEKLHYRMPLYPIFEWRYVFLVCCIFATLLVVI